MHDDAISPEQRHALLALAPAANLGFYLAGGTALCLRLAHRRSVDLDLFRPEAFDAEHLLRQLHEEGVPVANARTERGTLWVDVNGVETSLMTYPYAALERADEALGVSVASLTDLATMKIEAISSPGAREDFVDLYFVCQDSGLGLGGALRAFERRFAEHVPDVYHRVKALTYFEDAEREPELLMLRPVDWQDVRSYFEAEVKAWWQR
jgi:hypothetical protein